MKRLAKQYYIPIGLICTAFVFVLLPFLHGDVPIRSCILFVCLYVSQAWLIQLYEGQRAFLTSVKDTKHMQFGGLFGIFVRIPIVLISYYGGIGLCGFAVASGIDYFCRGLYYRYCSKKLLNFGCGTCQS